MTTYLILLLVAALVAYVAIRLFRLLAGSRVREIKMVALSDGKGNWRVHRQKGFVKSDRPGAAAGRRDAAPARVAKAGPVRKPWGW